MADQRTMAELLHAPTEGYAEAIVVPPILVEQFELKHSLINMMTSDKLSRLEKDNLHDHIRWFNKITSTVNYKDVPNAAIKLMIFPFSLVGAAHRWLEKEPPRSILTWEDLVSKFINKFFPPLRTTNLRNEISNFQQRFDESFHEEWDRYKDLIHACPHHGFTKLHQFDTFYNALNPTDQDSLNSATGGNLLERRTQDVLTIIENKSKIAKLTHAVNQQTSDVTTAMTVIHKQFQATPPPASVKAVEEICVTCGSAHSYYQWSGSLPSNTIANPKGELKAITTRSSIILDGPFIPIPLPFINLVEDEYVEETLTDQDLVKYTIKVPPPLSSPFKQGETFRISNAPLNENCSAVILKKLPEKLGDPGKFLIPCGFSELKCKALANLAGIARDVFVPVGKFTFPADFVIVDYESDTRVPLILGRPFLRIARALIDVHGEEMILRDDDGSDLPKKLLDLDSTKDLHPPHNVNPHSGSTTFSSSPNHLLEEFADELALITFPLEYDLTFDIESDLKEIEYLLHHDPIKDMDSSLKDSIDQKKIKESKLLIDELDLPSDFLPSSKYDSFLSEDFSKVDALPSTNNKDKVFNLGILIQETLFKVITRVAPDKNAKKLAISHSSLILEDFDHPLYELPFFKEVPRSKSLLSFSSENEGKVFKP
uniref:Reverse transcriptase domain-containing protein n=1 Tax=Tanacetum cinerariifolium TaxID=118510 RepID=A0A6L2MYH6_TANCI|nr:reverse transcriptase domain-containing protein [Tanacetum cinerariifolium]